MGEPVPVREQYIQQYDVHAALREVFGLRPIREFDLWLEKMGFSENGKLTRKAGDASVFLSK